MKLERALPLVRIGEKAWNLYFVRKRAESKSPPTAIQQNHNQLQVYINDFLTSEYQVKEYGALIESINRSRDNLLNEKIIVFAIVAYHQLIVSEGLLDINILAQIAGGAIHADLLTGCLLLRPIIADLIRARFLEYHDMELVLGKRLLTILDVSDPLLTAHADDDGLQQHLADLNQPPSNQYKPLPTWSASQLFGELRKFVIGQDDATRVIAARGALHLRKSRLLHNGKMQTALNEILLFVGPSGSGKTHLVNRFGALCGLPYTSYSCTDLTACGYVGGDPEDPYAALVAAAGNSPAKGRFGVLLLDEIDKTRPSNDDRRDVGGSGVQHGLLRYLEGAEITLGLKRNRQGEKPCKFTTVGVFHVLAGCFSGLDEAIKKISQRHGVIGFQSSANESAYTKDFLHDALSDWFVPELQNRLTGVVVFNPLNFNDLCRITQSPQGPLEYFNKVLAADGISISIAQSGVEAIAEYALQTNTLARGIKYVLNKIVEELLFEEQPRKLCIGRAEVRMALGRGGVMDDRALTQEDESLSPNPAVTDQFVKASA